MSDELCIHDMDPLTCSLCKPKGKTRAMRDFRAARRAVHAKEFQAQYDGTCSECGEAISTGENIVHGDEGGYVHSRCLL